MGYPIAIQSYIIRVWIDKEMNMARQLRFARRFESNNLKHHDIINSRLGKIGRNWATG